MGKVTIHMFNRYILLLSILSVLSSCSSDYGNNGSYNNSSGADSDTTFIPGTVASTSLGTVMVTTSGRTLYTFEDDRNDTNGDGAGDSDCNGSCANTWPPTTPESGATASGQYTLITRDDGVTLQWAFKGLPLYLYAGDSGAGDTNGEGFSSTWFVARPDPFVNTVSSAGTLIAGQNLVIDVNGSGGQASTRSDKTGYTLYVFDDDINDVDTDGPGDSDCNGSCAVIWPPLYADMVATASSNYSIISRDDGSPQWALKGEPLYFYAGDSTAGDVNGDNVSNTWHIARVAPVQLYDDAILGSIFTARGSIRDVNVSGDQASTSQDKTGFTVYLFDNDINDVDGDGPDSDCNGTCAVLWPPLYATAQDIAAGDFTIINRADGSHQWAYKGAPLYFYSGDGSPHDTNGVYATWHEVSP